MCFLPKQVAGGPFILLALMPGAIKLHRTEIHVMIIYAWK